MRRTWLLSSLGLSVLAATPAVSEVTKFEIVSRGPAFEGRSFGAAGPVEMIVGKATFAVDPMNIVNRQIVDLDRAPRNARGHVEATTDVVILRPRIATGPMLVDLPNRGGALLNRWLHDATDVPPSGPASAGSQPVRSLGAVFSKASDGGNGFLFENGMTVVEVGWQGDVPTGIGLQAPVIEGLTGPSRESFTFAGVDTVQKVILSYPAAAGGTGTITARATPDADAKAVDGLTYRQLDPKTIEVTRPAGMGSRTVYEFNYTATDPAVMGMGFAALRDVVSFLKFDKSASNPLAPDGPPQTIGFGISQSGRALRDFLYFGFNVDEQNRQVFDGMLPVVPGARKSFTNARFAQPSRNPGPSADRLYPVAQFPFAYETSVDPSTGAQDGILKQCRVTSTCPKIVQIDSEYEFWASQAGLNVTDVTGKPLALPPEVRAFMIVGAPHSSWGGRVSQPTPACKLASSSVQGPPLIRALIVSLNQWLGGTAPPASRYPTLEDGTLGPASSAYPANDALPYQGQYARAYRVAQTPTGPVVEGTFNLMVPQAGTDGNSRGGVKMPMVAVPRGSYTGWNPLKGAGGPEYLCEAQGSAVPFAATRPQRAANDTRPTIEELYHTEADYVAKVKAAADELVAARLLLPADAEADVKLAEAGKLARLTPPAN
jgi:hypothetical protein